MNLLTFKHSASEYNIDYSAFNAVYKAELSPKSQKAKDVENEDAGEVEEEEETKYSIDSSTIPNSVDNLRTISKHNYLHSNSCLPNYVPETYLKYTPSIYHVEPPSTPKFPSAAKFVLANDNGDFHKARSCAEIMHMV